MNMQSLLQVRLLLQITGTGRLGAILAAMVGLISMVIMAFFDKQLLQSIKGFSSFPLFFGHCWVTEGI